MGSSSPHTTLLNQIKNFVLTDEVEVKSLHNTLQRQVNSQGEVASLLDTIHPCWSIGLRPTLNP